MGGHAWGGMGGAVGAPHLHVINPIAMRSRWDDAEAGKLSELDLLVYASRLIGAETSLVVWGGGNTSIKTVELDHRGREIPVLRGTGTGSPRKCVPRKEF